MQARALTNFRHDKHDRRRGDEMRGSHDQGGGDRDAGASLTTNRTALQLYYASGGETSTWDQVLAFVSH